MKRMSRSRSAQVPFRFGEAFLLLCAIISSWPLWSGRWQRYMDNPVHLSEILELAAENSWSELAFCGMPLTTLHSPLWYGIAAQLVRIGVPADTLYVFLLITGFVTPALSLYIVGRRRNRAWQGLLAGWLWLMLPFHISGFASALAGMWTFHLGCGGLILLADALTDKKMRPLRVGMILAVIGLTHIFTLVAAVLLIILHWVMIAVQDDNKTMLIKYVGICAVAALASMPYWAPILIATDVNAAGQQTLTPPRLFLRIIAPTEMLSLILRKNPIEAVRFDLYLIDALPSIALWIMAIVSFRKSRNSLAVLSIMFSTLILLALLLAPLFHNPLLGPVSWRYVSFIYVGLALCTLQIQLPQNYLQSKTRIAVIATMLVFFSAVLGLPLRDKQISAVRTDLADLKATWQWLEKNSDPSWGRLYVQDTYTGRLNHSLGVSHIAILTHQYSGLPQIGSYYGVNPYPTGKWTNGEFKKLFGNHTLNIDELNGRSSAAASGAILLSHPKWKKLLDTHPHYQQHFEQGRFSVWVRNDASSFVRWAHPTDYPLSIQITQKRPDSFEVSIDTETTSWLALTSIAYHPWWKPNSDTDEIKIKEGPMGLMLLQGSSPGSHRFSLEWQAPRWPVIFGISGWLGMLLLALRNRLQNSGGPIEIPLKKDSQ